MLIMSTKKAQKGKKVLRLHYYFDKIDRTIYIVELFLFGPYFENLIMRKRYTHNVPVEPLEQHRIRNRFPQRDASNNAVPIQRSSATTLAISSIAASSHAQQTSTPLPKDGDSMEFQYDREHDDMDSSYERDDIDSQYDREHDDLDSCYERDEESIHSQSDRHEDDDENEGEDEVEEEEKEEEEQRQIVDEALSEDKMLSCNGEFSPYFENFTTASLFCWLQKHNISTSAYEDLADILQNTKFNPTHVVKNVRRFRTWRQRLPILPISARSISISSKKTPSTSKDSKIAYQLSVSDIIYYVLNNPSMFKHMYFGSGIDSETKSEYWHGALWGESPLFGENQITILEGNGIYLLYS